MIHTHLHPGLILKETVFDSLGLSITRVAKQLDWPRVLLSHLVNAKVKLRAPLAVRLEQAGFGTAHFWVNLQASYDMWEASQQQSS
jgi:addiction module HigA family antidote